MNRNTTTARAIFVGRVNPKISVSHNTAKVRVVVSRASKIARRTIMTRNNRLIAKRIDITGFIWASMMAMRGIPSIKTKDGTNPNNSMANTISRM
jgi:hypothetical protein